MSIERTNPFTGTEYKRRQMIVLDSAIEAKEPGAGIGEQEIHTTVDGAGLERVFRSNKNIGRTYHLGNVANEAAMLALDSPFASHACLPGDTCFRTDTQQIMRCISNYGASQTDWEVVPTDVQKTAGVVVRPTITRNGNGTVTVGSDGIYALYTDDTPSVIGRFSCSGDTFTLTEGATHYLLARYSGGSASLLWTMDRSQVEGNFRTVIPIETLYLFGGEIHGDSWGTTGHALAERMLNRLINTSRYVRDEIDGGLALGELTGRIVTISSGSVWRGVEKIPLAAFNSSSSGRLLLHVWNGTAWTVSQVTQYDNTNYQGASGLVALQNTNRYAVNWLFRTGGDDADCVLVLGTGDYTIDQALASGVPANLPALATRHGFLVGRIIVAKGAASAYRIESAFTTSFQSGVVLDHGALSNLQGGTVGEYYHQSYTQWLRNQSPNTANNVAVVGSDGKLLPILMPDIAVVDFLGEVSSQIAMLALVGQKGDWCTRTDLGTNWQIVGNNSSQLSSWRQLTYPQSPVNSVFGETGAIVAKAAHYSSFYLGLHGTADDSAKLGGQLPSYYSAAGHMHTPGQVGLGADATPSFAGVSLSKACEVITAEANFAARVTNTSYAYAGAYGGHGGCYNTFSVDGVQKGDFGTLNTLVSGGSVNDFGVFVRGDNKVVLGSNDTPRVEASSSGLRTVTPPSGRSSSPFWRLGDASSGYVYIEVGGVVYKLAATPA